MMNQPKPYQDHTPALKNACTDGTGFDFESVLGRTDGSVLVVGLTGVESRERRR
ncbi:MAG: hypothetical protein V4510_07465 [bacterium]